MRVKFEAVFGHNFSPVVTAEFPDGSSLEVIEDWLTRFDLQAKKAVVTKYTVMSAETEPEPEPEP